MDTQKLSIAIQAFIKSNPPMRHIMKKTGMNGKNEKHITNPSPKISSWQ